MKRYQVYKQLSSGESMHITSAPSLIEAMKIANEKKHNGNTKSNYYVTETIKDKDGNFLLNT